ncbi:MAG: deoxyribodipyrimidine photo-lyase [Alphaproteobacteria bacterium]|nr:deoxyribodipyrimidine photo-lyase [Alphaproteobacteria bacterium]
MSAVICWFFQDLRLSDHPALTAAIASGKPVIPVYIYDDVSPGKWAPGGASRWWLDQSLRALDADLRQLGSQLIIGHGRADMIIPDLAKAHAVSDVYAHTHHDPWARDMQVSVTAKLKAEGVTFHHSEGVLLWPPGSALSKVGERMRVFTPFKKSLYRLGRYRAIAPRPAHIPAPAEWPEHAGIDGLTLINHQIGWHKTLTPHWQVGEAAAQHMLADFIDHAMDDYKQLRDFPSLKATSRLSPYLHFGEISPLQILNAVESITALDDNRGAEHFISEVVWREFSYELLDQRPDMPQAPLKEAFSKFPWIDNYDHLLTAWKRGQTGYPLVDAGMRELYATGWMHNRIRMITASFLTKHLLIPWQEGEDWFFDTLVDADLASNSAGWQWVAGSGADASPYFRIFNPITQGFKFEASEYVRRWLPELNGLSDDMLFDPSSAPPALVEAAGVQLGKTYPHALVDHATARQKALDAYEKIKAS